MRPFRGTITAPRSGHAPYTEHLTRPLLTAPRSPTTTGKIERFHRALRAEFDTTQVFKTLPLAQQALDEWVAFYNTQRPHQGIGMQTPSARFSQATDAADTGVPAAAPPADASALRPDLPGQAWVTRRIASNGVVSVAWQQVSLGKHRAGARCDVLVTNQLLQFWVGEELLKTVQRTSTGEVRKKHAATRREQP